jgi:hypothetical protein
VFVSSRDEGRLYEMCDLYVMDATDLDGDRQGDDVRRITFDSAGAPYDGVTCDVYQPEWSPVPGSSLVAFGSTRDGYFDIWVVDVDNPNDLRNVTNSPTEYDDSPSWSPDGSQIVFRSSRSGAYELWSLPVPPPVAGLAAAAGPATAARAATPTRLTTNGGQENSPGDEQSADWGRRRDAGSKYRLEVTKTGTGAGKVTSTPAGITCGSDCAGRFASGAEVTLTAVPGPRSTFTRWRGVAFCDTNPTCVVTMDTSRIVRARFDRR